MVGWLWLMVWYGPPLAFLQKRSVMRFLKAAAEALDGQGPLKVRMVGKKFRGVHTLKNSTLPLTTTFVQALPLFIYSDQST